MIITGCSLPEPFSSPEVDVHSAKRYITSKRIAAVKQKKYLTMTETLQKLTLSEEEIREKILINPTIKDESRQQKSVQWYGKKDMRIMDIPMPRITDPVRALGLNL